jgi:hypothetical protein
MTGIQDLLAATSDDRGLQEVSQTGRRPADGPRPAARS